MPLYIPAGIPAGTTTGGDLTVSGNLIGSHDVSAAGNLIAAGGNGLKLLSGATPLSPTSAATMYALSATNLPAYVSPSGQIASVGGVLQAQAATVTVASTAAITALTSYTVPAGDVAAGAVYRITGLGVYSWTATPTFDLTLLWGGAGGTALATIPVITLGTAQTNATFSYSALVVARSTTTMWGELELNLGATSAADIATKYVATSTAVTTVVTTGANDLVVAVTWGASSSSNTISLVGGCVERLA